LIELTLSDCLVYIDEAHVQNIHIMQSS